MLTVSEKIQVAEISQFLVANDIAKSGLFGGGIDRRRPRLLYMIRKNVSWMYGLDTSDSTLLRTSNYLYSLCRNNLEAERILGISNGGGQITPVIPPGSVSFEYLIPITAADFANATDYSSSKIAGKQVEVYWTNVQNFETPYGWQIIYTPTGFTVFVDDGLGNNSFNAQTTNADAIFKIFIVHPTGTATSTPTWGILPYTGIGGETFFTDPALVDKTVTAVIRGTPYGVIISGTPNDIQALSTPASGRIDFAVTNPINTGELILVFYQ